MDKKSKKPLIGITIGDTNGVGPEIILKSFSDSRLAKLFTPVIYASGKFMTKYRKAININFNFGQVASVEQAIPGKNNVINCWDHDFEIQFGTPTRDSGQAAFDSLKTATKDLIEGKLDALVTAPINKNNIQKAGFDFPGHTEYITKESGSDEGLMFMISEDLKVGVATGHIPLEKVKTDLSQELILKKANMMFKSLKNDFGISKPKIALLGMNPHAGEQGKLGNEENDIIIPAIETLKEKGVVAYGPYPADGFFGSNNFSKFDGILAMYHDQGLIPFKALSFGNGVNYTAGLKVIRTSPDHGTAFDIAGKNLVNTSSFHQAIYNAIDIIRFREKVNEQVEA